MKPENRHHAAKKAASTVAKILCAITTIFLLWCCKGKESDATSSNIGSTTNPALKPPDKFVEVAMQALPRKALLIGEDLFVKDDYGTIYQYRGCKVKWELGDLSEADRLNGITARWWFALSDCVASRHKEKNKDWGDWTEFFGKHSRQGTVYVRELVERNGEVKITEYKHRWSLIYSSYKAPSPEELNGAISK